MLAAIASFFSALLESSVARFLAFKIAMAGVFLLVLPIVFNNFIYFLIEQFLSRVSSMSVSSAVVQFTGVGAYLASLLKLPEGVSILLSGVALRFTLSVLKKVF